ncbi:ABC transporter substrate-binding protein [Bradyrhizobium liaoningense]|uniref:ABC transporter substrate-binding protein n=1 Tax=Bradyrhizobium liaoningense TaxID=43992 RepID=UPI001BA63282|nr:ABC transporter substrate-binding protein [Bradyrhizobium liaoningense]MBR0719678.1 ABC transporter substrate-binding protein [Bradyrhizobium liaoningense]
MKRRQFIAAISGAAAAWPLVARAQQSTRVYRIALVPPSALISELSETGGNPFYRVIFEELRRLGYVEGRNLSVARYSGGGRTEHYAELAREVVRAEPDVIVTFGSLMVQSFRSASSTIPIVTVVGDPAAQGFAASLARPGGSITGATPDAGSQYLAKHLEVLKEAIPTLSTVGYIIAPAFWENSFGLAIRDAAPRLGIQLIPAFLESHEEVDYRKAFAAVAQRHVGAVIFTDHAENFTRRRLIVELAEMHRLPVMIPWVEIVEIGGFIAYAPDRLEHYRYLASCVDKVLRGAKPGDVPIYQSIKFKLAINLKTAKALGLVIPEPLLARADLVIE